MVYLKSVIPVKSQQNFNSNNSHANQQTSGLLHLQRRPTANLSKLATGRAGAFATLDVGKTRGIREDDANPTEQLTSSCERYLSAEELLSSINKQQIGPVVSLQESNEFIINARPDNPYNFTKSEKERIK